MENIRFLHRWAHCLGSFHHFCWNGGRKLWIQVVFKFCHAISAGCTNALILVAELHFSRKSPVVSFMSLSWNSPLFTHIWAFLHFTYAICKGLFCYGIYNKNGVCSKVPVSDVKGYGTLDITVAFAAEIMRWLQKCLENVTVLSNWYTSACLSEILNDIWAQKCFMK